MERKITVEEAVAEIEAIIIRETAIGNKYKYIINVVNEYIYGNIIVSNKRRITSLRVISERYFRKKFGDSIAEYIRELEENRVQERKVKSYVIYNIKDNSSIFYGEEYEDYLDANDNEHIDNTHRLLRVNDFSMPWVINATNFKNAKNKLCRFLLQYEYKRARDYAVVKWLLGDLLNENETEDYIKLEYGYLEETYPQLEQTIDKIKNGTKLEDIIDETVDKLSTDEYFQCYRASLHSQGYRIVEANQFTTIKKEVKKGNDRIFNELPEEIRQACVALSRLIIQPDNNVSINTGLSWDIIEGVIINTQNLGELGYTSAEISSIMAHLEKMLWIELDYDCEDGGRTRTHIFRKMWFCDDSVIVNCSEEFKMLADINYDFNGTKTTKVKEKLEPYISARLRRFAEEIEKEEG